MKISCTSIREFHKGGTYMNQYEKEQQIIEWLQEYTSIKASIKYLNESVEDIAEAGMGICYDKEKISPTYKFSSGTENAVIRMEKADITNRIKSMCNIVKAIDNALTSLTETEKIVITNRCIKRQYYYQFCYQIGASERTAKRIKKDALKKMVIVIFGKE